MRYLSIVCIVFLLVFTPSCKFIKEHVFPGRKERTLASLMVIQDSIRVADSLKKAKARILAAENAKIDSARKAGERRMLKGNMLKYSIIVGSFTNHGFAEGLADEYRKKGFNSSIIIPEGSGFELVAAETFESLPGALLRLKEIQDSTQKNAWLYTKN